MPKKILVVDCSPHGDDASVTRKLTAKIAADLALKFSDAVITHHDLETNPLPHLSARQIAAFFMPPQQRSDADKAAIARSDAETDMLLAADILVIGAPMWNFGIPSALKAWIDHVVRAGRTFAYGPDGFAGLATGKKAIIAVSSGGGGYEGGPMKAFDFVVPYLRTALGFIGITDVSFVYAENQSRGGEAAAAGFGAAEAEIGKLMAGL